MLINGSRACREKEFGTIGDFSIQQIWTTSKEGYSRGFQLRRKEKLGAYYVSTLPAPHVGSVCTNLHVRFKDALSITRCLAHSLFLHTVLKLVLPSVCQKEINLEAAWSSVRNRTLERVRTLLWSSRTPLPFLQGSCDDFFHLIMRSSSTMLGTWKRFSETGVGFLKRKEKN